MLDILAVFGMFMASDPYLKNWVRLLANLENVTFLHDIANLHIESGFLFN